MFPQGHCYSRDKPQKNKCDFVEAPKMWRPMGQCPLCPLGKSGPEFTLC